MSKRVAIIGAGPGGLTAAKAAIEEGLDPVVFEQADELGGVWRKNGLAWPNMPVNVSKYNGVYSDFPFDKNVDAFPQAEIVRQYLNDYAKKYKLLPHIHYQRNVNQLSNKDSKWLVSWNENGVLHEETFDGVIVATGKYSHINQPHINGLENFKGNILHSSQYKSAQDFAEKNILVCGGAISGVCIAEETAETAKQVIHSMRRPRWVFPRYVASSYPGSKNLIPYDLTRSFSLPRPNTAIEKFQFYSQWCGKQQDIPAWKMQSDIPFAAVVADYYLDKVKANKIDIQPDIADFEADKVVFANGESRSIDTVIFCTGYHPDLSFIKGDYYNADLRLNHLYFDTFPADLVNIGFLGLYTEMRSGSFPLLEMQARWACAVISGRVALPSKEEMRASIALNKSNEMDGIQFAEEMAKQIGAYPDFDLIAKQNPELHKILTKGALIPARFRLQGDHCNPALAEQIIKDTEEARQLLLYSDNKQQNVNYEVCRFFNYEKQPQTLSNNKTLNREARIQLN